MNTYLLWLVSFALLVSHAYGGNCKKYLCQNFNTGGTPTCVSYNAAVVDQLVRSCSGKNTVCDSNAWTSTDMATKNGTCITQPTAPANLTLPGDICSKSADCFGAVGEVSCSKTCQTKHKNDGYCFPTTVGTTPIVGHEWCPVGYMCDLTNKKCIAQKNAGDVCTAATDWVTGSLCAKVGTDTQFKCTKPWTVASGTQFDASLVNAAHVLYLTKNDLCITHHLIAVTGKANTFECRTAPTGDGVKALTDLVRTNSGDVCKYTAYDDPANKDTPQSKQDVAKCGFNKDDGAYCNKRKGDPWFVAALKALSAKNVAAKKCHALSSIAVCKAFTDNLGATVNNEWRKELLSTDEGVGYAPYANNDKCVAGSITKLFWQDTAPGFAFSSFTMTSFAAMVLSISALFYMF